MATDIAKVDETAGDGGQLLHVELLTGTLALNLELHVTIFVARHCQWQWISCLT